MHVTSINTWRVKLKSTQAARDYLAEKGYVTWNNIHYFLFEGEEKPIWAKEKTMKPLLISSYISGTSVNSTSFRSMLTHARFLKAAIVIIPQRGKLGSDIDPRVQPYIREESFHTHGHDILCGFQVNPSALYPLSKVKRITKGHSIIGHPTQCLFVKPTVQGMPSVLWSTGTISHQLDNSCQGWIVLDPDGTSRNIQLAETGEFTDGNDVFCLHNEVFGRDSNAFSTLATVWGDVHIEQVDPNALDWAIDLTRGFNSPNLVLHDFFDATSINPHSKAIDRSGHKLVPDYNKSLSSLGLIEQRTRTSSVFLVESNHNDMLDRYFKKTPIEDMEPQEIDLMLKWLQGGRKAESLFSSASIRAINEKEPPVKGTILGLHGDKGINGAKGSLTSLHQNSIPAIIGHSHTPGMVGNSSQVGCLCKLKMGYNDKGLSSWCHSIVRLDCYGKHQHFIKFDK